MKLDERRWAVGVHAPVDMAVGAPDLMGTRVYLDGKLFEIRGIVPNVPLSHNQSGATLRTPGSAPRALGGFRVVDLARVTRR